MNQFPPVYQYPYYVNAPMPQNFMTRNNQYVPETLRAAIKEKAEVGDFYSRLASHAPNQQHQQVILRAAEEEKLHWRQLNDLYVMLTGRQPACEIEKITFDSYQEGLQKACQTEAQSYETNRQSYASYQHSPFSKIFWRACHDDARHAEKFHTLSEETRVVLKDYGTEPFVVDIEEATLQNDTFRTALWTGENLQVTLMTIGVGDDIGLEVHPDVDQFLRIEQGEGLVQMGDSADQLDFEENVEDDYAIMVPAGKWHNLTNTGDEPLKLYTIYAPPEHPFGTVHETKADALAAEE
ncbi:Mannose-6-phosphate isomerase, cupin superfamily [Thalassobacillus cyri]|uniref:Mannose-6-phosphate isomerase, cupin superfamily n=2 Tax=Thalassobacillus cyri TaxID=571932 RepID=A0A1H3W808_9BACI|nr:Mannose-6-phosphate isomerase, cupin superfamily [Thalassobacillus cyri]